MTATRVLSRKTGEFLLALLEQPRPAIAGTALEGPHPDIGTELKANSSLPPVSASRSIQIADDNGISTLCLSWAPDVERYAYFDAADGWGGARSRGVEGLSVLIGME